MATFFSVYIPVPLSFADEEIKKGSAIVGFGTDLDTVDIYYEGNIYDIDNLRQFEERLLIASGRLESKYPTVARMRVNLSDLLCIGRWDNDAKRFELSPECVTVFQEYTGETRFVYDVTVGDQTISVTSKLEQPFRETLLERIRTESIYQRFQETVDGVTQLLMNEVIPNRSQPVPLSLLTDADIDRLISY